MLRFAREALDRLGIHAQRHRKLFGVDWVRDLSRFCPGQQWATVFDVGANVGQTVTALRRRLPAATIHAFEPVPSTYDQLVRAVGGRPRVHCHRLALSDRDQEREIITTPLSVHASFDSALNREHPEAAAQPVTAMTADTFCRQHGLDRVDILKVDTEGHELAVLAGATGLFARGAVRAVYAEVGGGPANRHNTPFTAVNDHLVGHGFRLLGLYEVEWLQLLPAETAFCNALYVRTG